MDRLRFRIVFMTWLAAGLVGLSAISGCDRSEEGGHQASIESWREARHERLSSDSGWLTLVGLEWLQDGDNSVGSAAGSDATIPGGPASWGTVVVDGDTVTFRPDPGAGLLVDGESATETRLIADTQGEATVVSHGDLSFIVIHRQSFGLRIKDRQAPTLTSFEGIENYPISENWRIDGRFIPAEEGATIEIANVLGQVNDLAVYGNVEFERDGKPFSLIGLGDEDSESLWFLFADKTSGRETYGAGRFVYSDGMPENGRLVVDFNKAYNPPCAFNDYSTCPLPPQQNRMAIAVTAGEKDFHH